MRSKGEEIDVLTAREAGARLRLGRAALYRALQRGDIPGIRVGGKWLVPRAAFERFLERPGTTPSRARRPRG